MTRAAALLVVLAILACVLSLLAALGAGTAYGIVLRGREPLLAAGRAALVEITVRAGAAGPGSAPALPPALRTLRRRELVEIVLAVAPSLSGNSLAALRAIAEASGVAAHARRQLGSVRWERRLGGARLLTAIGAPFALDRRALLSDRRPVVRVQAATWAANDPGPELVEELLALLADPDGRCRFAAKDTLVRLGIHAVAGLTRVLDAADPATLTAALEVAAAVSHPRYVEPAVRIAGAGSTPQRALAATVLGACGDPTSTPVLRNLLADPEPEVRRAAVRAIGELGDWAAAPMIAELLRDPSWPVRREAGLALLGLSAPGMVMLREATRGTGDAAGVAIQALELAALATVPAQRDRTGPRRTRNGPATDGPATSGLTADGPTTSGPATDGPATDGPIADGREPELTTRGAP